MMMSRRENAMAATGKPTECSNCKREIGPGGAGELCGRCYQFHRRNGELPPVDLLYGTKTKRIDVRVGADLFRSLKRAARDKGIDVTKVARDILEKWAETRL
jgi:hypothetical protein